MFKYSYYSIFIFFVLFIALSSQCPLKEDGPAVEYRDATVHTNINNNSRNFWVNPFYKWPKGVIPYVISPEYSPSEVELIRFAISHWETQTCVRFVPRTNQRDYAEITPNDGTDSYCYCYVGKIGGKQVMKMFGECMRQAAMVHELGHLIGFNHEHQRPDRDDFVNINLQHVDPPFHYAFDKYKYTEVNNHGQAYDYTSVMQYPYYAFTSSSDPSKAAITLKDGSIDPIREEAKVLSPGDIVKTQVYYNNCQ